MNATLDNNSQHCTVECRTRCVRLHTLLHVVGNCCAKFETGQTSEPTTPNIYSVL